jgi:hypothetical protein
VYSLHRRWAILPGLEPFVKMLEVVLQSLRVLLPGYAVDTCRGTLPESPKGDAKSIDGDQMSE